MKKMFAVAAVLLVAAVIIAACSSDKGGGGAAAITNDAQAKTSTAAAMGSIGSGVGSFTTDLGVLSGSITTQAGYAKRLAHVKKLQGRNSNPVQAKMNASLKKALTSPAMKKAMAAKANVLKSASTLKTVSVSTTIACMNNGVADGNFTVTGTDNSDDLVAPGTIWNITVSFNNCKESDGLTYWYLTTGTFKEDANISSSYDAGTGSYTNNDKDLITITNLSNTDYAGSFTGDINEKDTINVTFGLDYVYSYDGTTYDSTYTGTDSANGSFTATIYWVNPNTSARESFTLTMGFGNMSDKWTGAWMSDPTGAGTDEWTDTLNGSFTIGGSYQGQGYSFVLAFSNLSDVWKSTYTTNGVWSKDEEWINGAVTYSQSPVIDACSNGSYVFVTDTATPLTWTAATYDYLANWCADSGTIKINNVTLTFTGSGAGSIDYGAGVYNFVGCELSDPLVRDACGTLM